MSMGSALLPAAAGMLGFGAIAVCALVVLSLLLIAADPVLEEQAALAKARG
jgi:hypothetical protein